MSTPTDLDLPPEQLMVLVERCLDMDDKAILDLKRPSPIDREVFAAGWDRFAINCDLHAKRLILEQYREAVAALHDANTAPVNARTMMEVMELCEARGRAREAARAFRAVAGTYKDRHGYARAAAGRTQAPQT